SGDRRVLVDGFRSAYGIDVNWAPDSERIAYVTSGLLGKGELHILDVTMNASHAVIVQNLPSFDISDGERPPLWSADSQNIYAVGTDGKLWQVDAASGRGLVVGDLPGHQLQILVAQPNHTTVWSNDRGRTIWAVGRTREGQEAGFYEISPAGR